MPSFIKIDLAHQEENSKIDFQDGHNGSVDFQDGHNGSHLEFLMGLISAIVIY